MFPFVRAPLAPPNQRNDILSIISLKEHILASAKEKQTHGKASLFLFTLFQYLHLKKN
jgi:hypothetical protein